MTAAQLERERRHHARLDAMAAKCSARTEADETHLGCAYCAYLAVFYDDQRVILNGGHPRERR